MDPNRLQVFTCVTNGDRRNTRLDTRDQDLIRGDRSRRDDIRVLDHQFGNFVLELQTAARTRDQLNRVNGFSHNKATSVALLRNREARLGGGYGHSRSESNHQT